MCDACHRLLLCGIPMVIVESTLDTKGASLDFNSSVGFINLLLLHPLARYSDICMEIQSYPTRTEFAPVRFKLLPPVHYRLICCHYNGRCACSDSNGHDSLRRFKINQSMA